MVLPKQVLICHYIDRYQVNNQTTFSRRCAQQKTRKGPSETDLDMNAAGHHFRVLCQRYPSILQPHNIPCPLPAPISIAWCARGNRKQAKAEDGCQTAVSGASHTPPAPTHVATTAWSTPSAFPHLHRYTAGNRSVCPPIVPACSRGLAVGWRSREAERAHLGRTGQSRQKKYKRRQ